MGYLLGAGTPVPRAFQSCGKFHLFSVLRHVMKQFIRQATLFLLLLTGSLVIAAFFVPSREMSESMLKMVPVKNVMLRDTPSPRIIFVGGSNLSMGLNSEPIAKAFGMPVVNMGLHGNLGLKFMLDDVVPYARQGDVIVIVPEYEQFQGDQFFGKTEVLGVVFDIMPTKRETISLEQWLSLCKYVPHYTARKIFNTVVSFAKNKQTIGDISSDFNEYGDNFAHWSKKPLIVLPKEKVSEPIKLNELTFNYIEKFVRIMEEKKAVVFVLPPCFQSRSYWNTSPLILKIENEFVGRGIPLRAKTARYCMDDCYFYDTPYHLTKSGVDLRTELVLDDLRKIIGRASTDRVAE